MNNTLTSLNNYLFEQIERLNDDSLDEEQLEKEIKRSETIQRIAGTIIQNGEFALKVKKHMDEYGEGERIELPMIGKTNKGLEEENEKLRETEKNLRKRIKKAEAW